MKKNLEHRLNNKVALVTGASRGVGKAIVERMSIYGMKIGLLARSEQKLREVQELVKESGSEAIILRADLRIRGDIEKAAGELSERFGTPDFLINNAGIGIRDYWNNISLDDEIDIMDVNYKASLILIRFFLPSMLQKNRGHIININTVGGLYAAPYQGAYCASKAALLAYSTSLAHELQKTGVRISSIFPGPIDTDFLDGPNFEGFKKSRDKISPYEMADKVLSIITHQKERVFIGPFWKSLLVKTTNFNPCFFRKIIENKNIPPKTT